MKDKKDSRGGRRKGAGRPKGTGRLYSFRADKEVADVLDRQANRTAFIRECISKEIEARRPQEAGVPDFGVVVPAGEVKPMTLPFFEARPAAGFPVPLTSDELAQDIELLRMLCPHPDSSYLIRVAGNSMIECGIHDGDILIVDKSNRHPSERQAAVCELNGEYTVKRVVRKPDGYWLLPANPEYPDIKVREGDGFSVWGVVTYVIHKPVF